MAPEHKHYAFSGPENRAGGMTMARRKAKPVETPPDFTEARRQAMGFTKERTHVMQGERRTTLHTIRRQCPAMRWGWLSDAQRAALVRYADLAIEAQVTVKGCLAPQGGGEPMTGAERRIAKRQAYQAARKACSPSALAFTDHVLLGDDPPSWEDVALSTFGAPREAARISARALIGVVATDLVRHFAG
jgi:hypothetical protein